MLTQDEQIQKQNLESLANLKFNPGYKILIENLQSEITRIEIQMLRAETPGDSLRLLRHWQISKLLTMSLINNPEMAHRQLEHLSELQAPEGNAVLSLPVVE